jgi:hypothetical protein
MDSEILFGLDLEQGNDWSAVWDMSDVCYEHKGRVALSMVLGVRFA